MTKTDFAKTPEQVKKELDASLEALRNHLSDSKGHGDKGANSLLNALGIALVLLANSIVTFWLVSPAESKAVAQGISRQDSVRAGILIDRIQASTEEIAGIRQRVIPAMAIDAQLSTIRAASGDLKSLVAIDNTPSAQK